MPIRENPKPSPRRSNLPWLYLKIACVTVMNMGFVLLALTFTKNIDKPFLSKWEKMGLQFNNQNLLKMKANGPFAIEIKHTSDRLIEGHVTALRSFKNVHAEWSLGDGVISSDPRVIVIGEMAEGDERVLPLRITTQAGSQKVILGVVNEGPEDRFGGTQVADLGSKPEQASGVMNPSARSIASEAGMQAPSKMRHSPPPLSDKKFFQ